MDPREDAATSTVRELLDELREAQETREDAERRIVGLRKLIEGYIELYPLTESLVRDGDLEEDEFAEGDRPRGMEAAHRVLLEHAGNWYTVQAILDLLDRRGWAPHSSNPKNAVRAALERLVEGGVIEKSRGERTGNVVYSSPAPPADEFGDEEPF